MDRGHVDDLALAADGRAQLGEAAAAEESAVEVGPDRGVEGLRGQLGHGLAGGVHACVVHQDVEGAERFHGPIENRLDLLFVSYVGLDDDGASARRLDGLACPLGAVGVAQVNARRCRLPPSRANSIAVACPIPEPDPVMSATLPFSRPVKAGPFSVRWTPGQPVRRR